ncbi:DMT family transporter [Lentisphaera profundi]|uniref:DMT family transporter n=1 Tax=Lentisphaera profundi TaxID=1658616 RepID=A0ABY7VV94_9BACT|nr:DMT family transporter [Lentisphaera profundi]WDE97135.1 DMT family transporter [Lentisphaera profundi]
MKYILMLCIGLIWGSQFLLNDYILKHFSPLGLAALRMFFGFITLSIMILLIPKERKKKIKLDKKLLILFIALGATDAAIPFYLIGYGQQQLDSAVVAIILGIIPVFTALLQNLVGKGQKAGRWQYIGMAVAFVGLFILINPSASSFSGSLKGYAAILGAAFCFAWAFMFMDRIPNSISALHASRFILMLYSIPFLIYWLYAEGFNLPTDSKAWAYLFILGVFASGIVYLFYIQSVRIAGPTFTSFSNYLVPLVGTFLGVFFLGESFTINIALALIMTILGLIICNRKS